MRSDLQSQFLPERLALLEALEELFEDAYHYSIDVDAFGPLFELEPGLCAYLKKLRVCMMSTFLALNVAQSVKDALSQIALYARLFGDHSDRITPVKPARKGY